jgi:hypothetical protein
MTQSIADTFVTSNGPTNGAVVNAFKASRFSSPPTLNTPFPGVVDAGPVTTGPEFGGPGTFAIGTPTNEPYYCSFTYNGQTTYKLYNAADFVDGAQGQISLSGSLDGAFQRGIRFAPGVDDTDLVIKSQLLSGPKGEQGPQGVQGAQGFQCDQGTQ